MSTRIRCFCPVTVANFAAGFDVLGMALAPVDGTLWGDVVEVCPGPGDLQVEGSHAHAVPRDPAGNLASVCGRLYARRLQEVGKTPLPLHMVLHKELPVASGLGSSASSIVAALVALNAFHGEALSSDDLLDLAGQAEGGVSGGVHLDNVAPALRGGLQLVAGLDPPMAVALPFPENLVIVVVHPEIQLSTASSRSVLPLTIPRARAVSYWQNLAAFVHSLHSRDEDLLRSSLHDGFAEPARASLVPGFATAGGVKQAALDAGALGCSLSGSGPSVFAVAKGTGENVRDAMVSAFEAHGVKCTGRVCRPDAHGARLQ